MQTIRLLLALGALLTVSSVSVTPLSAEDGVGCKNCTDSSGGGGGPTGSSSGSVHSFGGPDCTGSTDPICRDCHAFNACHTGPQGNGTCETNHWACGATQAGIDAFEGVDLNSTYSVQRSSA